MHLLLIQYCQKRPARAIDDQSHAGRFTCMSNASPQWPTTPRSDRRVMRFSLLRDASGTANLFSNSGTYWRRTGAGRWPIVRVLRGTRIHAEVAPPTVGWRPGFSSIDVGSRGCFHTAEDSKFSGGLATARTLHRSRSHHQRALELGRARLRAPRTRYRAGAPHPRRAGTARKPPMLTGSDQAGARGGLSRA